MNYREIIEKGFEDKIVGLDEAKNISMKKWGDKFIDVGTSREMFKLMHKLGNRKDYTIKKLGYIGSVFYGEEFEDIVDYYYKIFNDEGVERTAYALIHSKNSEVFIDLEEGIE